MIAYLILALFLGSGPPARAAGADVQFQNVLVRPGDTLWSISHTYLKDPTKWDEILKYNRLPSADPTVALPGMTLRVPITLIKVSKRAAYLVYSVNKVLFRRTDHADWKDSKNSMELYQGDTLRTLEDSRARVKFLNTELLSLEPNSMAVIKPVLEDADIVLKSGAVFAGRARVVTRNAVITPRTKDTRYSARVGSDLSTKVEVYTGLAAVAAQGSTVEVPAGMETRVAQGLAPEVPKPLSDPATLEARAAEFNSAIAVGGRPAPNPRAQLLAPKADVDVGELRGDIDALHVGVPIQGFHIQAALDPEFKNKVFDRKYDSDERFNPADAGLKAGSYWWHVAITDLLGVEGRFSEPRQFSLGIKRIERPASEEINRKLTVFSPAEGSTINADHVNFVGVLRDERLTLEVNGRTVRLDRDGNWAADVALKVGVNQIELLISDGKGNAVRMVRRVTRP